jgi:hypothetical protein
VFDERKALGGAGGGLLHLHSRVAFFEL